MPLYLDELWLDWSSPEQAKRSLAALIDVDTPTFPFPEGARIVAGPWFSNEETKLVFVIDIADHAKTFGPFGLGIANGIVTRRRLSPVVEWSAVRELLKQLP